MTLTDEIQWFGTITLVAEYLIKIIAVGTVPENRRPGSSTAWLLLILTIPIIGLPLFYLLGSPYVRGRRHRIQAEANDHLNDGLAHLPDLPPGAPIGVGLQSIIRLNRTLTSLPCVTGCNEGISYDYEESITAMAAAIEEAHDYVHVEFYIMAWDDTTDVFFTALTRAVQRGVTVRLLLDHIGSARYKGWRTLRRRLDDSGIDWHMMMPIQPLRGRWRRPDLRNHRKLLVIDSAVAFIGSQNLIEPGYHSAKNHRIGRRWQDVMVRLSGQIVSSIEAVFAVDWYSESGEVLAPDHESIQQGEQPIGGAVNAFQLIPSGPGFATEPNLRLFTSLLHRAQYRASIVSPYFVPDESLFAAITTAAYRGVAVELFVSEQADQFMVHHAQSSYYQGLLEAGVRIYRYPKPHVLHAKFIVFDDDVAVFGSSNLDMRSFNLDYEVTLMGTGGDFVAALQSVLDHYHRVCIELTPQQWLTRPWHRRYLDNAMRLTSALQ